MAKAATTPERLARIETMLEEGQKRTHGMIDDIHHRLFGNGQPGLIADLQRADEDNAQHVRRLDRKMILLFAAAAILSGLAGFFTGSGPASLQALLRLLQ